MLWAQRFGREFCNEECRIYWTQTMTQFVVFWDGHLDGRGVVADAPERFPAAVRKLFPLSYVSTWRGLVISLGSHSRRAAYMHFDARADAFLLGHDNADRGTFTFSALEGRWIDDLPWKENVDSTGHSLLHVDGLAQAEKAPSVAIVKVEDGAGGFVAEAALTYACNVQWAKGWQGENGVRYGRDGGV